MYYLQRSTCSASFSPEWLSRLLSSHAHITQCIFSNIFAQIQSTRHLSKFSQSSLVFDVSKSPMLFNRFIFLFRMRASLICQFICHFISYKLFEFLRLRRNVLLPFLIFISFLPNIISPPFAVIALTDSRFFVSFGTCSISFKIQVSSSIRLIPSAFIVFPFFASIISEEIFFFCCNAEISFTMCDDDSESTIASAVCCSVRKTISCYHSSYSCSSEKTVLVVMIRFLAYRTSTCSFLCITSTCYVSQFLTSETSDIIFALHAFTMCPGHLKHFLSEVAKPLYLFDSTSFYSLSQ